MLLSTAESVALRGINRRAFVENTLIAALTLATAFMYRGTKIQHTYAYSNKIANSPVSNLGVETCNFADGILQLLIRGFRRQNLKIRFLEATPDQN